MKTVFNNRFELVFGVWSDYVNLENLSKDVGMTCDQVHISGKEIQSSARRGRIIAKRHYTGLSKVVLPWNDAEVNDWATEVLSKVSASRSLVSMLVNNDVEATLWISVLGDNSKSNPPLPKTIIDQAKNLNISILIENYTYFRANPSKTWVLTSPNTPIEVI